MPEDGDAASRRSVLHRHATRSQQKPATEVAGYSQWSVRDLPRMRIEDWIENQPHCGMNRRQNYPSATISL